MLVAGRKTTKRWSVLGLVLCAGLLTHAPVQAELSGFLNGLNVQAHADVQDYGMRLSAQFGRPLPEVNTLMRSVAEPADAFMCLQLSQMLGLPPQRVLNTYNQNRGRGWGTIAKSLGIKPGSPEFHALKQGGFRPDWRTRRPFWICERGARGQGTWQGKGKGKRTQ